MYMYVCKVDSVPLPHQFDVNMLRKVIYMHQALLIWQNIVIYKRKIQFSFISYDAAIRMYGMF